MSALQFYERGGVRVLPASGEFDLSNSEALEAAISGALDGIPALVLDLTDVEYIDSTVLGVLARQRNAAGPRLQIVGPRSPKVRRVFEITGLAKSLALKDNLEGVMRLVGTSANLGNGATNGKP
jgi:anti-anti-sigma factor